MDRQRTLNIGSFLYASSFLPFVRLLQSLSTFHRCGIMPRNASDACSRFTCILYRPEESTTTGENESDMVEEHQSEAGALDSGKVEPESEAKEIIGSRSIDSDKPSDDAVSSETAEELLQVRNYHLRQNHLTQSNASSVLDQSNDWLEHKRRLSPCRLNLCFSFFAQCRVVHTVSVNRTSSPHRGHPESYHATSPCHVGQSKYGYLRDPPNRKHNHHKIFTLMCALVTFSHITLVISDLFGQLCVSEACSKGGLECACASARMLWFLAPSRATSLVLFFHKTFTGTH